MILWTWTSQIVIDTLYAGFSASASAQYNYSTSLSHSRYYALCDVAHTSFSLVLKDPEFTDSRINQNLVEEAKKLPEWAETNDVYRQYVKFFRRWGTHVIKSCTFGARYQLRVESDASKYTSKQIFQAHVSAECSFVAQAKAEAGIKSTSDYSNYLNSRSFNARVKGGSSSSNLILSRKPDDPEKYAAAFDEWARSLDNALSSNLIDARLDSVGNLLQNSSVEEHRAVAGKLVKALEYLASMRKCEGFLKIDARQKTTDLLFSRGLELSVFKFVGGLCQLSYCYSRFQFGSFSKVTPSGSFAGQQAIDIYVSISILTPPGPVRVKLSVLSGDATTTALDLSPGGPTLSTGVLPSFPAFKDYTFPATSLFVPRVHFAPLNIGPVSNAGAAQLLNIAQNIKE
ncbi:MAC/Perforin domain-containing protein [Penicillium macrosclerotiorum]|uniref:MAC/Perforin domain-containing protein n=1 Tax=Penicillium macrosclerotiorum TaxID=303699 RepID=UPI0025489FAD|nr:MAC/Perforin domain-containing protein [Penicillium macrosclerotiorum]KAJ5675569.1 MAC/Perforin domain-containing protein [Penicillium macrosclerotiorum]